MNQSDTLASAIFGRDANLPEQHRLLEKLTSRTASRLAVFAAVLLLCGGTSVAWASPPGGFHSPLFTPTILPGNPAGDLRLEINVAPNLIVDSNVETPSTYAPQAFYAGVKYCNDGTDTLWNVFMHLGNFAANTPGIYPARTHPGLTGTFSLTHEGGSMGIQDASRYLPFLAPGECFTQFWLLSYPRLDDNGNSVTQATNDPNDDLWLNFDAWASADDNGTPLVANETRRVTMRNEISAMANKIWPNTTSKVPDEYLQVILDSLGWDATLFNGNVAHIGEPFHLQGVWYDFGVVNKGFDSDGDFVPDFDAWMQPVGDPSLTDPDCFHLVGMFGLLIVKKIGGGELLIPFEDNLYFKNLPENNGVVGLVYYRWVALDGPCVASMTPYQEVASGSDNEKFNGDYGRAIPFPIVQTPQLAFNKVVDPVNLSPLPDTLTYTINYANTGSTGIGVPQLGIPFVIQDSVPAGTIYIAGSATASNSLPAGVTGISMLYSTNHGATWSVTEPPAGTVTDFRWILEQMLPIGASGSVQFKVRVPAGYNNVLICNQAGGSLGFHDPFAEDRACALTQGNNSLGDRVWRDNGGTTGIAGNGLLDGNETGIANVPLSLYYDYDGDGELGDADVLYGSTTTNSSGNYLFSNLPDGKFLVVVCDSCVRTLSGFAGWGLTTPDFYAVHLDTLHAISSPVSSLVNDFGFLPALQITKVRNGSSPTYGNRDVSYTIKVENNLPAPPGSQCTQTAWATSLNTSLSSNSATINNAIGVPNSTYATANQWHNFKIAGQGFTFPNPVGAIAKVELIFQMYHTLPVTNEQIKAAILLENNSTYTTASPTLSEINQYAGISNVHELVFDVTASQSWNWAVFDAAWYSQINFIKTQSGDGSKPYVDAIGVRVTPAGCSESLAFDPDVTLKPVPLTDDYDPARLQFISATPAPDVVNTTTGLLTWNNVGPINGGVTKYISLTFNALQPSNLVQGDTTLNIAASTGATFANGNAANSDADTAGVRIKRSGSIAGVVWSDINNNGWQGTTGYEVSDPRLENIAVVLNTCTSVANNGTCSGVLYTDTLYTDNSGAYLFDGLVPDLYYTTEIVTSTLPGTFTQRGDPDDNPTPGTGTGNGGTCGGGGGNVACTNSWTRGTSQFLLGTNTWGGQAWDVTGINFGYTVNPAIFGNVWQDVDGDGVQEAGELPMSGVTVELVSSSCTQGVNCPTTTTNAAGDYFFLNLATGNYTVRVRTTTLPAGSTWTETAENDGSINNSIAETLTAGEYAGTHDFGWYATGTASVGDLIYYDFDGDGVKDAAEVGIPNISLSLYKDLNANNIYDAGTDAFVATTSTNASGAYLFGSLPPGSYVVVVNESDPDLPDQFLQTADPNYPGVTCVSCDASGQTTLTTVAVLTQDFGFQPSGNGYIGDQVWFDGDGDGALDPGETPIAGITVQLLTDLNNDGIFELATTAVTDASGNYLFENLPDGNFKIVVDSLDADLPEDATGTPYSPTTFTSLTIVLAGGDVTSIGGTACTNCNLGADFGFAGLGAVGDFIFWDANRNGMQDWTETGIAGVTVNLFDENDNLVATTSTSNGTDGNPVGYYYFTGLLPGDYHVVVDAADPQLGGATLLSDPSADGVPCTAPGAYQCDHRFDFPIFFGTNFVGADFGYLPKGVVGNYVWLDSDNDGVQDNGEPGLANIPVTILNQTAVVIGGTNYAPGAYSSTIYTDPDGFYTFSNLPNGTWTASAAPGAGYSPTFDADGTANNSTTLVISNGTVSNTGNAWCPSGNDCSLNLDFGVKLNGNFSLSGTVCVDDNSADGICGTGGENRLDSIVVNLYSSAGRYLGSTYTISTGAYSFSGLPAGTYYVSVGTTQGVLPLTDLTTTADDTPASVVTTNPSSIVQTVPLTGNTTGVDFAFILNVELDFGDLPAAYAVLLDDSPTGAYHILDPTPTLFLGATVDNETDGLSSVNATGDGADEDGVVFNSPENWTTGNNGGSLAVTVAGSGWLVAWMDFDRDGLFASPGELILTQAVNTGTLNLSFNIPAGTTLEDPVFARFRLFEEEPAFAQFAWSGEAENGEVEDYRIEFSTCPTPVCPPVVLDVLRKN